ncbi:MAG: hypothetical protein AMXMBFR83_07440 [Phycisphaerae bacterium]
MIDGMVRECLVVIVKLPSTVFHVLNRGVVYAHDPIGNRQSYQLDGGTATRTTDISHVPAQVTAGAPLPIKPAIPRDRACPAARWPRGHW